VIYGGKAIIDSESNKWYHSSIINPSKDIFTLDIIGQNIAYFELKH
jgi:hypothetical protein